MRAKMKQVVQTIGLYLEYNINIALWREKLFFVHLSQTVCFFFFFWRVVLKLPAADPLWKGRLIIAEKNKSFLNIMGPDWMCLIYVSQQVWSGRHLLSRITEGFILNEWMLKLIQLHMKGQLSTVLQTLAYSLTFNCLNLMATFSLQKIKKIINIQTSWALFKLYQEKNP